MVRNSFVICKQIRKHKSELNCAAAFFESLYMVIFDFALKSVNNLFERFDFLRDFQIFGYQSVGSKVQHMAYCMGDNAYIMHCFVGKYNSFFVDFLCNLDNIYRVVGYSLYIAYNVQKLRHLFAVFIGHILACYFYKVCAYLILVFIDDILGIVVLTILTALTDPSVKPILVLGRIVAFFGFVLVVGLVMYRVFLKMEEKWHHHRRIAIYAVAFAFLMSYVAERYFGIADITGAYFAGIVMCRLSSARDYVASKTNVLGYMLFSPLFFASIGIKTNLEGLTSTMAIFAVVLTIIAILTKIIGCGIGARIMGFHTYDAFSIGLGMVSRGEVALIVAQKGEQAGLIDPHMFPPIVLVVIVTTLVTPILLKLGMSKQTPANTEFNAQEKVQMPKVSQH